MRDDLDAVLGVPCVPLLDDLASALLGPFVSADLLLCVGLLVCVVSVVSVDV